MIATTTSRPINGLSSVLDPSPCRQRDLERQYRRNGVRTIRWLTVGLSIMTVLLALHSGVGRLYPDSLFNDIVGEAFVIAGWVSLWVPIERLGFDGWLLEDNYRLYRSLAEMEVDIQPDA